MRHPILDDPELPERVTVRIENYARCFLYSKYVGVCLVLLAVFLVPHFLGEFNVFISFGQMGLLLIPALILLLFIFSLLSFLNGIGSIWSKEEVPFIRGVLILFNGLILLGYLSIIGFLIYLVWFVRTQPAY